ncbi:MAG: hypothetical protein JXR91_04095 [Deltaproteobacteria bacterium]|nr:hypothetical protein [Deltaproteobacteria bacterium]
MKQNNKTEDKAALEAENSSKKLKNSESSFALNKYYIWNTVILIAVFILGIGTGLGLSLVLKNHRMGGKPPIHGMDRPPFHPLPLEKLNLTRDQMDKAQKILEKNRPEFDKIFKKTFPELRKATKKMEGDLKKILNNEQLKIFNALITLRESEIDLPGNHNMPKSHDPMMTKPGFDNRHNQ